MKEFELEQGEQVIVQVRKHWFIFVFELLPFALLALLPLALPRLLELSNIPGLPAIEWGGTALRALLGAWWLGLWTSAFAVFTHYYLDLWVLTNFRIVDINQRRFFSRDVSSLVLSRVQDITVETRGVLYSLLNIGTINVQSAGAVERFTIKGVPDPAKLRDTILKYVPNQATGGV